MADEVDVRAAPVDGGVKTAAERRKLLAAADLLEVEVDLGEMLGLDLVPEHAPAVDPVGRFFPGPAGQVASDPAVEAGMVEDAHACSQHAQLLTIDRIHHGSSFPGLPA